MSEGGIVGEVGNRMRFFQKPRPFLPGPSRKAALRVGRRIAEAQAHGDWGYLIPCPDCHRLEQPLAG